MTLPTRALPRLTRLCLPLLTLAATAPGLLAQTTGEAWTKHVEDRTEAQKKRSEALAKGPARLSRTPKPETQDHGIGTIIGIEGLVELGMTPMQATAHPGVGSGGWGPTTTDQRGSLRSPPRDPFRCSRP